MEVKITITAGTSTGPFKIYGDLDNFATPIITGLTRAQLVAGYTATVPDGTTIVRVMSYGVCFKEVDLTISGPIITTTTTTSSSSTTTTTTIAPLTSIGIGYKVQADSCGIISDTPEIFLNAADYAIFVSNGGCLSDGATTVDTIRDSFGIPISGTFYFVWYGGSCSTTTFKSTAGHLSINSTQC